MLDQILLPNSPPIAGILKKEQKKIDKIMKAQFILTRKCEIKAGNNKDTVYLMTTLKLISNMKTVL